MRDGRIVQFGSPQQLYDAPVNRYVADFVGESNFLGGKVTSADAQGASVALANGLVLKARWSAAGEHPSVGEVRSIGLFGIFELIRSRKTKQPMAPFNGTSEEMSALGRFFREQGLYTIVRWNSFYTNPPLCINEQQMREAFAIIDKGLEITDRAVKD